MFQEFFEKQFQKPIAGSTKEEIFASLLQFTKDQIEALGKITGKKKLYYISAEFLIGKLLVNNLINLGLYETVEAELKAAGTSLSEIEDIEPEPSLGNGGLGRLAACFLDSIATLGLLGDGMGLNYHCGLFRQKFEHHKQTELPNPWIGKESWLTRQDKSYTVKFRSFTLNASLYDISVVGYHNKCNTLHLFDIDSVEEGMIKDGIQFDKRDIRHNLTLFLYPDDSDYDGKLLRLYQQYFMVSCSAQYILDEAQQKGSNLYDLSDYAVIQINDTHPALVIPELIYQLNQRGMDEGRAVGIVKSICAYTNHTILSEALEKWPLNSIELVAPHLVPILKRLDDVVKKQFQNPAVSIIDDQTLVHMAHLAIHFGFSVNGVAKLHTDILEQSELRRFYDIYPEKFNNKTNGITFRRWLMACNRELTDWIKTRIGDGFLQDEEQLKKLLEFENDETALNELIAIKQHKKTALKHFLSDACNVLIDDASVYDIQIKRLHEYKRQQLNALYLIHKYLEIKRGNIPPVPITAIFAAKAAPAYTIAKDIIHLILCLSDLTEHDSAVSPYLKVVMVENYNVTIAQKLIPACDISEQISLASKEASGTGNMKLMLNGAVTLGTMDGANVEIAAQVGEDSIYIFGASSEQVIARYEKGDYRPDSVLSKNPCVKEAVSFLIGKELLEIGDGTSLRRLHDELTKKDWFMTLPDFDAYVKAKDKAISDYTDKMGWAKKMLRNIAGAGYFSSDRTIADYNRDIWKL